MKKNLRKSMALICMVTMTVGIMPTANVMAEESSSIIKEEKVYGVLNYDGSTDNLVVSNYIHSEEILGTFADVSELEHISNLKTGVAPEQDQTQLTWNVDGHELYYQGTSSKALPIITDVTYYLNDEKLDAKDLIGASGELRIVIHQTNTLKDKVTVDGIEKEVFVPFYTVMTMGLKTKSFTNVTINQGKIVNDGHYFFVVGGLIPGMTENLEDFDQVDLEEDLIITAQVTDYEQPPIYLMMSTQLPKDQDIKIFDTMDELDSKLKDFSDGANKLEDGANQFYESESLYVDGLNGAFKGIYSLNDGIEKLKTNGTPLKNGFDKVVTGVESYTEGASGFSAAVGQIVTSMKTLIDGIGQLVQGIGTINEKSGLIAAGTKQQSAATDKLYEGFKAYQATLDPSSPSYASYEELLKGLKSLSDSGKSMSSSVATFNGAIATLTTSAQALGEGAVKLEQVPQLLSEKVKLLEAGSSSLTQGKVQLDSGFEQWMLGFNQLYTGSQSLNKGVKVLDEKSSELLAGAGTLKDGIEAFNKDGVKKVTSEITTKEDQVVDIFDLYNALEIASESYTSFSGASDEMTQKVEFILKVTE